MTHPDCQMPDGADPCKGYSELYAEYERLRNALRKIASGYEEFGQAREIAYAAIRLCHH